MKLRDEGMDLINGYRTGKGVMTCGTAEQFLRSPAGKRIRGKVQLLFTSPPFPLTREKRYGNLKGEAYEDWLGSFALPFGDLLTHDGSIVIEMGNGWERGSPTMSTTGIRALLKFMDQGSYHLCQQLIWHNKAKLPGPAQWVNINRERVTDGHTNIWWFSKSTHPKADNRRVLRPYSSSMNGLLERGNYNSGLRPSEHLIGSKSFLANNGGAIPASVLSTANTASRGEYLEFCKQNGIRPHPARMHRPVVEFFINLLTDESDLVLDPFAGSNQTGEVAESLNRRWRAVEPDLDHVLGSVGRFPATVRRLQRKEMMPASASSERPA